MKNTDLKTFADLRKIARQRLDSLQATLDDARSYVSQLESLPDLQDRPALGPRQMRNAHVVSILFAQTGAAFLSIKGQGEIAARDVIGGMTYLCTGEDLTPETLTVSGVIENVRDKLNQDGKGGPNV